MSTTSSHNTRVRRPNGRRPTVIRSKSFMGTIKNFLPAPLAAWLGSTDDFATGNTNGKRRNVALPNAGQSLEKDGPSRAKRIRVASPDRQVQSGYLDPPGHVFQQQPAVEQLQTNNHPSKLPNRSSSVATPSTIQQQPRNRHTASPFRSNSFSRPESISRTMSMDPPHQRGITVDATMFTHHESSVEDNPPSSHGLSMPTARPPFRMRTSLTPSSRSSFGPISQKGAHVRSEPPPLTSLTSKPVFVRAPPYPSQGAISAQLPTTLGSLIDSQHNARSPVRQHSILLFSSQSGSVSDISSVYPRPINAAEKALHELEIYKTPLLPSRLKGSAGIPDMFKPRKAHKLILMHGKHELDHQGTSSKRSGGGKVNGTKPYAGEGGMKKLLARRRKEAEEERKEKYEAMDEDEEVEEEKDSDQPRVDTVVGLDGSLKQEQTPKIVPVLPPAATSNSTVLKKQEHSSLRVGRTKTSRNHISRPVSRAKNRFSARCDEDDGDEADDVGSNDQTMLEEAAKNIPVFNIPSGFTFAQEVMPTQHDLTKAKEPPIATLPFSFSNPSNTSVAAGSSQSSATAFDQPLPNMTPPVQDLPVSVFGAVPLAPTISLVPPTPIASESLVEELTGSPIPNSSARSSVLTQPSTPMFTSSPTPPVPVKDAENSLWEGEKMHHATSVLSSEQSPQKNSSLFGGSEKAVTPMPMVGTPAADSVNATSAFSLEAPTSDVGASPAGSVSGTKTSPSLFGTSKATESTTQSFNIPKPTAQSIARPPVLNLGANNAESPNVPDFAAKPSKTPSQPPPLFGNPSTNSFGESTTTSPFGQLPTFMFSQPSSTTQVADVHKSPFSFGLSSSTTPAAADKPSFNFADPVPPSPGSGFSFGALMGSSASDVSSKPFSFGTTPPRPVTPPKNDEHEFRMEESPTRDMQLNGKQADVPPITFQFSNGSSTDSQFGLPNQTTSTPFSFAALSPNPFGKTDNKSQEKPPAVPFSGFGQTQPPTTGFSFGQKAPEPELARPSTAGFAFQPTAAAPGAPFTFGTPTSNVNPFNQSTTQGSSAPSSPSTFNQPPLFSFAPPAASPTASSPFTFGAGQPPSPAIGNPNLPQPSTPGGFNFANSSGATPASPFGATTSAAPTGGTLFTIGAAPAPTGGARPFKKLPNRRSAKR